MKIYYSNQKFLCYQSYFQSKLQFSDHRISLNTTFYHIITHQKPDKNSPNQTLQLLFKVMASKDQQKPTNPAQSRKLSLQKFLASTNIEQTKNSIRSIIEAHTQNINFQNFSIYGHTTLKTSKQNITGSDSHIVPLLEAIRGIKQPLSKLVDQNVLMTNTLQKIKTEAMNQQRPSHQEVHINLNEFSSWRTWMGKVFQEIIERSFHLYSNQTLLYDEMRAFCCEKLLLNLIFFDKHYNDALKQTPCIQWSREVKKIIDHECNKYPQTSQIEINKKLEEIVNRNKINNFQSDDYDLIDKTTVQFRYKSSNDYTEEIMTFLNHVITLPSKVTDKSKGLNLMANFHIFFSNVFKLVYHRDRNKDMELLMTQKINDHEYCKFRFSQEEDIEYNQKVRAYTKLQVGSKIPLHSPTYSSDQIVSGNIEIKSKPVARVVDKWIDELREKILNPQKSIVERIHRFKGENPGDRTKLTKQEKEIIVQKIKEQKANVLQFDDKIRKNVEYISERLMKDLGNLNDLTFMEQNQRCVGEFACKMQQASVQYSIQKLNHLIGSMLKSVQKMKADINKTKPYSFIGEDLQLNLVTFKIGDLLRCKFTSKQEEVIRVFEFLITMSQMSYLNIFKIIRIKNRLNQSTRDILINAMFKNQVVCEIQLAINQTTNQKQKIMDKFNHFLYELKRAQTGTMLQVCNIWVNNCPKSETFKKSIIKEIQQKRKRREGICVNAIFVLKGTKHNYQRLPFVCKLCKIFYPGQKIIFQNIIFEQYPDPVCGQCLSTRVQKVQRLKYIFAVQDKPSHIANYMIKFEIYDAMKEIFTFEEIKQHEFMILAPIASKKINKFAIRRIDTHHMTFLVQNYLTEDGSLQMKVKHQFLNQAPSKEQQKEFFSKYCLFTFNKPIYLKEVTLSKQNFNSLLQCDFKKIQTFQQKNQNRLQCVYMSFGEQSMLFPHYFDPTIDQLQKLKNQMNVFKIIRSIKDSKEVLELSNQQLVSQMDSVPPGIKLKINTIVRELYLDDNLLEAIDFVTHIHGLVILTAKNNRINIIPQMPQNIEIVDLAANRIQQIGGFGQRSYQKLRIVKLCANQIEKIQNLDTVPNLKELSLYRNNVRTIEGLDRLRMLVRLNLSFNPIQRVENLESLKSIEYLSLGNTDINRINGMQNLQSLMTLILDVSNINLTSTLELPQRIKNLNLSNNSITSMQPLKQLTNIEQLILHDNVIPSIQPSEWLQNIRLLNLSRNRIEEIPQMKILTDLKQLYLSHNAISQIKGLQENLFLSVLDVSHNRLRELKNIKFLINLTKLSARNNQIEHLQEFQNLKSLNEIELANNLIETIITFPQSLKKINLENNRIRSLDWVSDLIKKKSDQDRFEQINLKRNQIPEVMLLLVKCLLGIGGEVNIVV